MSSSSAAHGTKRFISVENSSLRLFVAEVQIKAALLQELHALKLALRLAHKRQEFMESFPKAH